MNVGERIKQLRVSLKKTQKQLADETGLSRVTIGNYERGARLPNSDAIRKLAVALYTSPDFIVGKSKYQYDSDEVFDVYESYKSIPYENSELEEFLERIGYSIEPSIFLYDTNEEKAYRLEEWKNNFKQFYRIICNGTFVDISPSQMARLEENIMNYIEFEINRLKTNPRFFPKN